MLRRRHDTWPLYALIAALAVSVGSLRLQRGVSIDGPRSFDGVVIGDEAVRITGR